MAPREDNIRMNFREIWRVGADWMHLAQERDEWQSFVITVLLLLLLLLLLTFNYVEGVN
jgi:hypothetical protein